jgi:hypothetical protein
MNQNQFYKLNCLCHVFSQVTYMCSRVYISISSAKYDEFMKNSKFVSLYHFSQKFPFSNHNKLDPSPHRLDSIKHLNWTHKTQVWSLETIHKVWVDLEIVMRNFRKIFPKISLEYFHQNSKTKNHFHVKPTTLESQLNYQQLSCLHQRPDQNRNEGKRRKNAKQKKLFQGNFAISAIWAISAITPDSFAISAVLANFFSSYGFSHHFHPKSHFSSPQLPNQVPESVYGSK